MLTLQYLAAAAEQLVTQHVRECRACLPDQQPADRWLPLCQTGQRLASRILVLRGILNRRPQAFSK